MGSRCTGLVIDLAQILLDDRAIPIGKRGGLDGGSVSKIPFEISDNTLIRAAARVRSAESSGIKLKTTSAEGTRDGDMF